MGSWPSAYPNSYPTAAFTAENLNGYGRLHAHAAYSKTVSGGFPLTRVRSLPLRLFGSFRGSSCFAGQVGCCNRSAGRLQIRPRASTAVNARRDRSAIPIFVPPQFPPSADRATVQKSPRVLLYEKARARGELGGALLPAGVIEEQQRPAPQGRGRTTVDRIQIRASSAPPHDAVPAGPLRVDASAAAWWQPARGSAAARTPSAGRRSTRVPRDRTMNAHRSLFFRILSSNRATLANVRCAC
jgi:hypothetical protein